MKYLIFDKYKHKRNTPEELMNLSVRKKLKYIFFPFWSWIIPKEIWSKYNCIVFHTADLPFGRGGMPIHNNILRGIYDTKLCALKCNGVIDGGGILLKRDISLKGTLDQILDRIKKIIYKDMIPYILKHNPKPIKQKGKIVRFYRKDVEGRDIKWKKYCV